MQRTPSWVVSDPYIPNQEMLLNACRYLWMLEPKAMQFLVSAAQIVNFKRGDILTLEGHACNAAFLVLDGWLISDKTIKSTPTKSDRRLIEARTLMWKNIRDSHLFTFCLRPDNPEQNFYTPGQFIGEEQLLTGAKYSQTLRCYTDARVMVIDRALLYEAIYDEVIARRLDGSWGDDPLGECYQLGEAVFPKSFKKKISRFGTKVKGLFKKKVKNPPLTQSKTEQLRSLFDTPLWKSFEGPVIYEVKSKEDEAEPKRAFFYCSFHETDIVKLCQVSTQVPWWEVIDEYVRRRAIGGIS